MTVKIIGEERKNDIRIANEPFPLFGRMIVTRTEKGWMHKEEYFPQDQVTETVFPDENYDFEALSENSVFVGAYDGEKCVGLAILQDAPLKYAYLYDLKVNAAYRGKKAGRLLIEKCKEIALERGYRGLYTQGQDNNLGACLFYLKNGFEIGGLDTRVYTGTAQEGKQDILFYCDA